MGNSYFLEKTIRHVLVTHRIGEGTFTLVFPPDKPFQFEGMSYAIWTHWANGRMPAISNLGEALEYWRKSWKEWEDEHDVRTKNKTGS